MGFKSTLSGAFNSIKSAASSAFKNDYRTGVLNDFSIVTKAMFYILEGLTPKECKIKEKLPVQINPTKFEHRFTAKTENLLSIDLSTNSGRTTTKYDATQKTTIPLIYDIYDEYNVRTMDGNDALTPHISLTSGEYTSLPKLFQYWGNNNVWVLFKWGDISNFGQISEITCEYTAFSRWGEPLKAEASVTIHEKVLGLGQENATLSEVLIGQIANEEKTSKVLTAMTLAASNAAR